MLAEYRIVRHMGHVGGLLGDPFEKTAKEVSELLRHGWKTVGGASVTTEPDTTMSGKAQIWVVQALMREEA